MEKKFISVFVINGPNLNNLGVREPEQYGKESWHNIEQRLVALGNDLGIHLDFFQSNHEGAIVDFIQSIESQADGVVINAAALTKTGYSLLDALTSKPIPFVEVHMTNIASRGGWHADSILTQSAVGLITGFLGNSYDLGVMAINSHIRNQQLCE